MINKRYLSNNILMLMRNCLSLLINDVVCCCYCVNKLAFMCSITRTNKLNAFIIEFKFVPYLFCNFRLFLYLYFLLSLFLKLVTCPNINCSEFWTPDHDTLVIISNQNCANDPITVLLLFLMSITKFSKYRRGLVRPVPISLISFSSDSARPIPDSPDAQCLSLMLPTSELLYTKNFSLEK